MIAFLCPITSSQGIENTLRNIEALSRSTINKISFLFIVTDLKLYVEARNQLIRKVENIITSGYDWQVGVFACPSSKNYINVAKNKIPSQCKYVFIARDNVLYDRLTLETLAYYEAKLPNNGFLCCDGLWSRYKLKNIYSDSFEYVHTPKGEVVMIDTPNPMGVWTKKDIFMRYCNKSLSLFGLDLRQKGYENYLIREIEYRS